MCGNRNERKWKFSVSKWNGNRSCVWEGVVSVVFI